jgi:hypothetical protein
MRNPLRARPFLTMAWNPGLAPGAAASDTATSDYPKGTLGHPPGV